MQIYYNNITFTIIHSYKYVVFVQQKLQMRSFSRENLLTRVFGCKNLQWRAFCRENLQPPVLCRENLQMRAQRKVLLDFLRCTKGFQLLQPWASVPSTTCVQRFLIFELSVSIPAFLQQILST